jgi:dTDP-4-amino-4,6-dideoxygalactose transaminase
VTDKRIELIRPTLAPWREVEPLFAEVWESGQLTIGRHTARFEAAAAELMGVRHAVALNSCTSGLMLAVRALELQGEAIIPAFTWTSTGHALVWNNVTPVFADIDPETLTLDPADVKRRLTPRTRAIIAVNVFGLYPDLDALQAVADEAGVILLCDSAQAIGARYKGRRGGGPCRLEVFSFSPTKVVTAVEAGLVATDDEDLAVRIRHMRDYGKSADASDIESLGLSARLSEFHAIVGLANLRRVDELIAKREKLAAAYRARLGGAPGLRFQTIPPDRRMSWNYFVVVFDPALHSRDDIWRRMTAANVHTKRYFYPPLHEQGAYRYLPPPAPPLPVTDRVSACALALPFYSHMTDDEVAETCERLLRALG